MEAGIFNLIEPGVFPGIKNGITNAFNPNHLFGLSRQIKADGTGAAIQIKNGFAAGQVGKGFDGIIKLDRLLGINLEKGIRRD